MTDCPSTRHADEPVEGMPVWCRPCQTRIMQAIESLPGLAAGVWQLGESTGRVASGFADVNGGIRGTRVHAPTASPAWELIDELLSWANDVERRLRAHLGHSPAGRWSGGSTEDAAKELRWSVAYLCEWSTALLCCPFAAELGSVVSLARRAERASGLDRPVERLTRACPGCGKPRLSRADGSDVVRCRSCGMEFARSDLDEVFDTTLGLP